MFSYYFSILSKQIYIKTNLARKINAWYSDRVSDSLTSNRKTVDTQLSLKINRLKPLHACWLFHAFDFATQQTDVLKHGWGKTGLLIAIMSVFDGDNARDE